METPFSKQQLTHVWSIGNNRAVTESFIDRHRTVVRSIVALCCVVGLAVLADFGACMVAEYRIARQLRTEANLPTDPKVQVHGFFVSQYFTGNIRAITVRTTDLNAEGFGLVSVTSSAEHLKITPKQLLSGKYDHAPTKSYHSTLRLDGVALGKRLGMTDLIIANHKDMSPLGQWETEADLTGTVDGFEAPATVHVRLRIDNGDVWLLPESVISGPVDHKSDVEAPATEIPADVQKELMEGFKLTLIPGLLPLRTPPTRIYVTGGMVNIQTEELWTKTSVSDLAPQSNDDETKDQ